MNGRISKPHVKPTAGVTAGATTTTSDSDGNKQAKLDAIDAKRHQLAKQRQKTVREQLDMLNELQQLDQDQLQTRLDELASSVLKGLVATGTHAVKIADYAGRGMGIGVLAGVAQGVATAGLDASPAALAYHSAKAALGLGAAGAAAGGVVGVIKAATKVLAGRRKKGLNEMENINKIVQHAAQSNPADFQKAVQSELYNRIADAVAVRRVSVIGQTLGGSHG